MPSEPRVYAWKPAFELGIDAVDEERWLLEHILRSDRKYARWIEETNARSASTRQAYSRS